MKNKWLMGAWKWFIWKAMSPAQILIGRKVRFSACKWECKRNNPLKNSPGTYTRDQKLFLKLGQSLVATQIPGWRLKWPEFKAVGVDYEIGWYQDFLWITQKQQSLHLGGGHLQEQRPRWNDIILGMPKSDAPRAALPEDCQKKTLA